MVTQDVKGICDTKIDVWNEILVGSTQKLTTYIEHGELIYHQHCSKVITPIQEDQIDGVTIVSSELK